jgi:uncharacterized protein
LYWLFSITQKNVAFLQSEAMENLQFCNVHSKKEIMSNLINWFEIPVVDFDRALNFYRWVLQTEIEVVDCGEEKMGCFPWDGEGVTGAISLAPGFLPSENGVQITFEGGDDLNYFLDRVEKAGGKIVRPKTKIEAEGRGYFAQFMDTEGNRLGVYSQF